MYYRIAWCITKNALGGTRYREEPRLQDVIVWLAQNVKALEKRAAGFSVYECRDDEQPDAAPVTVYNWQEHIYDPESFQNFGHLRVNGFPISVVMSGNHSVICRETCAAGAEPVPLSLEDFAACFAHDTT